MDPARRSTRTHLPGHICPEIYPEPSARRSARRSARTYLPGLTQASAGMPLLATLARPSTIVR
ncbi:hypothetical protein Dimus_033373, partial [Dionaea muscipula]